MADRNLIELAKVTNGHMPEVQFEVLTALCKGRVVLEFGSYEGRSSIAMASVAQDVYCCDAWDPLEFPLTEEHWDQNTRGITNIHKRKGSLYDSTHQKALIAEFMHKAGLVFIDAAHDYDSVVSDILLARILLKGGGILCGHDYTGKFQGVVSAVNKYIPKFRVEQKIWIEE